MAPQEIKKLVDRVPFQPLRFHLADQSQFEVTQRDQVTLTLLTLDLHFDKDEASDLYGRTEYLSPSHVVRVVPFNFERPMEAADG